MKIILSRKGFDSEYGGHPSPILPDGRIISLPIPSEERIRYSDLSFQDKTYLDLMRDLSFTKLKTGGHLINLDEATTCHLDPDIRRAVLHRPTQWKGLFGQIGAAQTHLDNFNIGVGDLFLFFGWFKKTRLENEKLSFFGIDQHVIFGYLQVGKKIRVNIDTPVADWMNYHPHANIERRKKRNNTIFVAGDALSFNEKLPGCGVFKYNEKSRKHIVLTKKDYPKSRWDLPPDVFQHVEISYHTKTSWKNDYFQSVCRGQEFVISDDKQVMEWANELIQDCFDGDLN